MATCPNCGRELPEGTKFCGYCGTTLENAQPAAAPYTPPQGYAAPAPAYGGYQPAPVPAGGKSPMMIVGMILSITALVLCIVSTILMVNISIFNSNGTWSCILACMALVMSIVGVILSAKGKHKSGSGRGMGTAGLIIGIIAIVYSAILVCIYIFAFAVAGATVSNANRIVDELNSYSWY